jgi:hypothetical protein
MSIRRYVLLTDLSRRRVEFYKRTLMTQSRISFSDKPESETDLSFTKRRSYRARYIKTKARLGVQNYTRAEMPMNGELLTPKPLAPEEVYRGCSEEADGDTAAGDYGKELAEQQDLACILPDDVLADVLCRLSPCWLAAPAVSAGTGAPPSTPTGCCVWTCSRSRSAAAFST